MKNRQPRQRKVSIRKWFQEIWHLVGQDPLLMIMIIGEMLEVFAVLIAFVMLLLVSLVKFLGAA